MAFIISLVPVHFSNEARGCALSRSFVVSRTYGGGGLGAEYIVLNRLRAENLLSTTMPMLCSLYIVCGGLSLQKFMLYITANNIDQQIHARVRIPPRATLLLFFEKKELSWV